MQNKTNIRYVMKKIILIAAAGLFAAFSAAAQDMAQATEIAQAANEALQSGDNAAALNGFKEALPIAEAAGDAGAELANTCRDIIPRILLAMGKDQIKEKNFDGALDLVNQAIAAAEEYGNFSVAEEGDKLIPNIKLSKANGLLNAKDFDGAAEAFKAILDADPENGVAALRLGAALSASGKMEEAKAAYEQALANGQEKTARKQLSNIFLKEAQAALKGGKFADAISAAGKSNEYLENANACKIAGNAAVKAKDNDSAIANFEKYLQLSPNAKDANGIICTLAVIFQQSGNKEKAIEYYQKIVTDPQYGQTAKAQIAALNK